MKELKSEKEKIKMAPEKIEIPQWIKIIQELIEKNKNVKPI